MIVKAKCNFAGALTMIEGEVTECNDEVILQDLLQAGYIEEVKSEQSKAPKEGVKKNESKRNNSK